MGPEQSRLSAAMTFGKPGGTARLSFTPRLPSATSKPRPGAAAIAERSHQFIALLEQELAG